MFYCEVLLLPLLKSVHGLQLAEWKCRKLIRCLQINKMWIVNQENVLNTIYDGWDPWKGEQCSVIMHMQTKVSARTWQAEWVDWKSSQFIRFFHQAPNKDQTLYSLNTCLKLSFYIVNDQSMHSSVFLFESVSISPARFLRFLPKQWRGVCFVIVSTDNSHFKVFVSTMYNAPIEKVCLTVSQYSDMNYTDLWSVFEWDSHPIVAL